MKNALVIIDVQNGFINDNDKEVITKIVEYSNKNHFDHIVATAYINNYNTACHIFEHWDECMAGTFSAEIVPAIQDISERIFEKSKYSCWNKEFRQWVKDNNIDRLYIVGVDTECCVLSSAFDSYNDLQDIVVVEDLCDSSNGYDYHKAGILILKQCITNMRVIQSSAGILPDNIE